MVATYSKAAISYVDLVCANCKPFVYQDLVITAVQALRGPNSHVRFVVYSKSLYVDSQSQYLYVSRCLDEICASFASVTLVGMTSFINAPLLVAATYGADLPYMATLTSGKDYTGQSIDVINIFQCSDYQCGSVSGNSVSLSAPSPYFGTLTLLTTTGAAVLVYEYIGYQMPSPTVFITYCPSAAVNCFNNVNSLLSASIPPGGLEKGDQASPTILQTRPDSNPSQNDGQFLVVYMARNLTSLWSCSGISRNLNASAPIHSKLWPTEDFQGLLVKDSVSLSLDPIDKTISVAFQIQVSSSRVDQMLLWCADLTCARIVSLVVVRSMQPSQIFNNVRGQSTNINLFADGRIHLSYKGMFSTTDYPQFGYSQCKDATCSQNASIHGYISPATADGSYTQLPDSDAQVIFYSGRPTMDQPNNFLVFNTVCAPSVDSFSPTNSAFNSATEVTLTGLICSTQNQSCALQLDGSRYQIPVIHISNASARCVLGEAGKPQTADLSLTVTTPPFDVYIGPFVYSPNMPCPGHSTWGECSGNGKCEITSGICECQPGFFGSSCNDNSRLLGWRMGSIFTGLGLSCIALTSFYYAFEEKARRRIKSESIQPVKGVLPHPDRPATAASGACFSCLRKCWPFQDINLNWANLVIVGWTFPSEFVQLTSASFSLVPGSWGFTLNKVTKYFLWGFDFFPAILYIAVSAAWMWVFLLLPFLVRCKGRALARTALQSGIWSGCFSFGVDFIIPFSTSIFLPIIQTLLSIFSCDYFTSEAAPVAIIAPQLQCWGDQHLRYCIVAGITLLCYYPLAVVAMPTLALLDDDLQIRFKPSFILLQSQVKGE
jgi:hypothetical protein